MRIYRIENPDTEHGMWYGREGNYDPFIMTLTEGKSKNLPMDPHPRYGARGRRWYSGAKNAELMNHWFSKRDAEELAAAGYTLFEFEADEFIVEKFQVIFTRESITSVKEIPLNTLWDI